ncbi:MAG TPA: Dabb family protein [Bacteroidales bacterium]|nr:Dabb family protein [Bacteroidales bacterium]
MIVHVVLWKLLDEACGKSKAENCIEIKERFQALQDLISVIQYSKVYVNEIETESNADVMLVVKCETEKDLNLYMQHHLHQELSHWVSKIRKTRIALDYIE